jgi:hypothetical protein
LAAALPIAFGYFDGCGGPFACPGSMSLTAMHCSSNGNLEVCSATNSNDGPLPSCGGTTFQWVDYGPCAVGTTCVEVSDPAVGAICSFTTVPVPECAGVDGGSICLNGYPADCVDGYPNGGAGGVAVPCGTACVNGFCALSARPDPMCPDRNTYGASAYCSDAGPVGCYQGFDVDFDAAVYPVPYSFRPGDPCATAIDAGQDALLLDAFEPDAAAFDASEPNASPEQ